MKKLFLFAGLLIMGGILYPAGGFAGEDQSGVAGEPTRLKDQQALTFNPKEPKEIKENALFDEMFREARIEKRESGNIAPTRSEVKNTHPRKK